MHSCCCSRVNRHPVFHSTETKGTLRVRSPKLNTNFLPPSFHGCPHCPEAGWLRFGKTRPCEALSSKEEAKGGYKEQQQQQQERNDGDVFKELPDSEADNQRAADDPERCTDSFILSRLSWGTFGMESGKVEVC